MGPGSQMNAWMQRSADGDAAAFASLALAVQDELYRFALAQGLGAADAAEAVQETLFRAYRSRHAWRPDGDAGGWLLGIAMNVAREFRRRGRHMLADWALADLAAPADARLTQADLGELARAMDSLPPRQREAIACRFLRQMSVRQTAQAMGCAEGTVKASVSAGLENLRKMLGLNDDRDR